MLTRAAAAVAAIGFVLTFGTQSIAADTQGPTALCTGDPELPGVQFHCQQVSVELVAGADIEDVIARTAPTATVIGLVRAHMWNLQVPPGEEPSVRDALAADPDVVYVSLWYVGYLSGADGLPDAAMTAYGIQLTTMLGFLMLWAAALVLARFRAPDHG